MSTRKKQRVKRRQKQHRAKARKSRASGLSAAAPGADKRPSHGGAFATPDAAHELTQSPAQYVALEPRSDFGLPHPYALWVRAAGRMSDGALVAALGPRVELAIRETGLVLEIATIGDWLMVRAHGGHGFAFMTAVTVPTPFPTSLPPVKPPQGSPLFDYERLGAIDIFDYEFSDDGEYYHFEHYRGGTLARRFRVVERIPWGREIDVAEDIGARLPGERASPPIPRIDGDLRSMVLRVLVGLGAVPGPKDAPPDFRRFDASDLAPALR